MDQLWAPWRAKYVSGEEGIADGCVICSIVNGAGGELVAGRDETTITILNRFPYSSGHLMISPIRHAADLVALTAAEAAAVMATAQRAVRALTQLLKPNGFNIGVNQGSAAGASLDHFHLHVVPRWHGDTNFMPVVGQTKVLPSDLAELASQLRQTLSDLE
jgi:ATP adenylyltransferase